jgi:hypothetical protein
VTWNQGEYSWAPGYGYLEYRDWYEWRAEEFTEDLAVGKDAVVRAANASWWNWDDGSTPFFWRWKPEYVKRIRDGVPVHFTTVPPRNLLEASARCLDKGDARPNAQEVGEDHGPTLHHPRTGEVSNFVLCGSKE